MGENHEHLRLVRPLADSWLLDYGTRKSKKNPAIKLSVVNLTLLVTLIVIKDSVNDYIFSRLKRTNLGI